MSGKRSEGTPQVSGTGDDELRAMLQGRAARVGAIDARVVLAAARAEIAGPAAQERGGQAFGVQLVRVDRPERGRPSQMPWRLAILGVAAVVAVAVLGSRLSLAPATPDVGTSPAGETATSGALGTFPASRPVEVLTASDLAPRIADGSLDGRVVLVDAGLVVGPWPCPSPVPADCFGLHVDGLDGVELVRPASITRDAISAHAGSAAPLALHIDDGGVTLLGWVVAGADDPLEPTAFDARRVTLGPLELAIVRGWLTPAHGEAICRQRVGGGCEGPHPRLTDTTPFLGGTWTEGVPGIDAAIPASFGLDEDDETMVGSFVVGIGPAQRGGYPPPYSVIATLDGEVHRVDQAVAPTDGTPAPPPAAGHMTVEGFAQALRLGELDGRVVVVEGRMRLAAGRCLGTSEDCTWFKVEGLEEVFIGKGDLSVDEAAAAIRRHPNVAPIALRVTGTGATLIGWITAGASTPVDVAALRAGDLPLDPGDVAVVAGWLLGAPASPSCSATFETCAMWPMLSPSEPIPGNELYGDTGMAVMVAESLGLPPAPATIRGPFVVAAWRAPSLGEPGFEVVDRFVEVTTVDALPPGSVSPAPAVTPPPTAVAPISPPAEVLTADELMTALANGSLDGSLLTLVADLRAVAWPCPTDVPEPCRRFYVDGLPGIALTYDSIMTATTDGSGDATDSATTGTMVVVPRRGHLELLGRLDADPGAPVDFGQAFDGTAFPFQDPFRVTPVTGWLIRGAVPAACPSPDPATGAAGACTEPVDVLQAEPLLPPDESSSTPGGIQYAVNATDGPGLERYVVATEGPFLVRPGPYLDPCPPGSAGCSAGTSYGSEILARYDAGAVIGVLLP